MTNDKSDEPMLHYFPCPMADHRPLRTGEICNCRPTPKGDEGLVAQSASVSGCNPDDPGLTPGESANRPADRKLIEKDKEIDRLMRTLADAQETIKRWESIGFDEEVKLRVKAQEDYWRLVEGVRSRLDHYTDAWETVPPKCAECKDSVGVKLSQELYPLLDREVKG